MPRLTITLDEEQDALLEEMTGEDGEYDSKSEAVRTIIQQYEEYVQQLTARDERIADLEQEVERLKREKRQILAEREEKKELVEYAKAEKTAIERREERERAWETAPIWRTLRWKLFGRNTADDH